MSLTPVLSGVTLGEATTVERSAPAVDVFRTYRLTTLHGPLTSPIDYGNNTAMAYTGEKSQFIREQPLSMGVSELIALAAKKKMTMTGGLVHQVRKKMRAEKEENAEKKPQLPLRPPASVEEDRHPDADDDKRRMENLLLTVASEIGLGRSIDLLAERRRQVGRLIRA